jgi:hypothetical protein
MNVMFGVEIKIGDVVLKPTMLGRSPIIEERKVSDIRNGKIYLDESKVAIQYPDRLVVFNSEEET